jgi:heme/copper-type cytochrome/quinol oxidase subunit 2
LICLGLLAGLLVGWPAHLLVGWLPSSAQVSHASKKHDTFFNVIVVVVLVVVVVVVVVVAVVVSISLSLCDYKPFRKRMYSLTLYFAESWKRTTLFGVVL